MNIILVLLSLYLVGKVEGFRLFNPIVSSFTKKENSPSSGKILTDPIIFIHILCRLGLIRVPEYVSDAKKTLFSRLFASKFCANMYM